MASITITIPDAIAQRALVAFCGHYGYQETLDGKANPETRLAFAKRMLANVVKSAVIAYEAEQAAEQARLAAIDSASSLDIS